jgi:hypothetical protein
MRFLTPHSMGGKRVPMMAMRMVVVAIVVVIRHDSNFSLSTI